ncbi:MAG: hypothetical protein IJA74_03590, partial [Oscillospiraceae bacterium]|nr:hypothetical protein [Oscillospiraceae bacterium]
TVAREGLTERNLTICLWQIATSPFRRAIKVGESIEEIHIPYGVTDFFYFCFTGKLQRDLLRCPIKSSGLRISSILSTAATRSPPSSRHRRQSARSPFRRTRSNAAKILIKIQDTNHKSRYGLIPAFRYNEVRSF